MTTGTSVQGADTFARTLRTFARDITQLTEAHTAAGELIARTAAQRSRRRTGRLAGSFTATVSADGVTVGSDLIYAPPQEFGWRRRRITPSLALTGAMEQSQPRVGEIYHEAVSAAASHVKGA